jgi:transposase
MVAYSKDLRERVLAAVDAAEGTQEEIAQRFRVSARWIRKLLALRARTGSIAPKPRSGGRKLLIQGEKADALQAAIRTTPDATLQELREATGFNGCLMTVWRAIRRLNITRKMHGVMTVRTPRCASCPAVSLTLSSIPVRETASEIIRALTQKTHS